MNDTSRIAIITGANRGLGRRGRRAGRDAVPLQFDTRQISALPAFAALLGDANRWVTGQRLEASGGTHL